MGNARKLKRNIRHSSLMVAKLVDNNYKEMGINPFRNRRSITKEKDTAIVREKLKEVNKTLVEEVVN
jgi:hypothetical protein